MQKTAPRRLECALIHGFTIPVSDEFQTKLANKTKIFSPILIVTSVLHLIDWSAHALE